MPTDKLRRMTSSFKAASRHRHSLLLGLILIVTTGIYWPGLYGGFLFDDYPNIVNNHALQIKHVSISSLTRAALSSPSSEFKRPLASLTFAANYLLTGLNPFWMKLTNVAIHLINGVLIYLLSIQLLSMSRRGPPDSESTDNPLRATALLITAGWLLLPINLTAVLYVVQRMASLATVFILLGLIGYVRWRQRMQRDGRGFVTAACALVAGTLIGFTAKETAVLTPLYAVLIEWVLFHKRHADEQPDRRIHGLFLLVLLLPLAAGLAWQIPQILRPADWATRDFSLGQRLLSEARVVVDYIRWTLLPTPHALSFYHDAFPVSRGWLTPWTTLPSVALVGSLIVFAVWVRKRMPLVALGLLLFFAAQSLTATILPLELVYEQRNYFASYGLLLAIIPLLAAGAQRIPMPTARQLLLGGLLIIWCGETASTAYAWSNPLRQAETLAERAPNSPRAQYALGRMFVILSDYKPESTYLAAAYAPLERAMRLPHSSILPEQALIMMNSHLHRPLNPEWWNRMIAALRAREPGSQDESSLAALTRCAREKACALPEKRMIEVFHAALAHPYRNARIMAIYGDYAWNVLGDRKLGLRMAQRSVSAAPGSPAYRETLIRMLSALGHFKEAKKQLKTLEQLNVGGRLDNVLPALQKSIHSP